MSEASRRAFLRGVSAAALAVPLAAALPRTAFAAPTPVGPDVRPRAAWAEGLPPPPALPMEQAGDVRFLLVHHSASPNGYSPEDVPRVLRGFHAFHTGAEKGWPDVAYNFFVDRYGVVWEGRTGSLAGPVMPDATGGSQGFAQICCFIGDHGLEPPTPEAQRAMIALLAELAVRYGVDPALGTTTTFVSRGSNRWPAGTAVTTTTIAGHRDMSLTSCPGDAAYPLVRDVFPVEVAALVAARAVPVPPPSPSTPPPAATPTAPQTSAAPSSAPQAADDEDGGPGASTVALLVGGLAAVGAAAGLARVTGRGRNGEPSSEASAPPPTQHPDRPDPAITPHTRPEES